MPAWASGDKFKTIQEVALFQELNETRGAGGRTRTKTDELEVSLEGAGALKRLLFETGQPLEIAVLQAMRLMGFEGNNYRDPDSEFDAVLECPEGRCIGEVEGRDNKAINIDKMRQLEVNIQEDFSRDEVETPAKAILFGNAHRLLRPSDRPPYHFTDKCLTAALRNGTALIRTSDLFEVAKALTDNPDREFAASCRKAIFSTHGKVVAFPPAPNREPAQDILESDTNCQTQFHPGEGP